MKFTTLKFKNKIFKKYWKKKFFFLVIKEYKIKKELCNIMYYIMNFNIKIIKKNSKFQNICIIILAYKLEKKKKEVKFTGVNVKLIHEFIIFLKHEY